MRHARWVVRWLTVGAVLFSALPAAPNRVAAQQGGTLPQEVLGREWDLVSLQQSPQNAQDTTGVSITIKFDANGSVSGSGGCNRYAGSYTAGPNQSLTFSPVAATKRACLGTEGSFETQYFAALATIASYTLDGTSRLLLVGNNGQTLLIYQLATQNETCFVETGNCVRGRFLEFWRQNGGLAVFGFPLSAELNENGRAVQYFERQRFELHPENEPPYDVQIGRLGDEVLLREGTDWFTLPKASGATPDCRFFPETEHSVCDLRGSSTFLSYWGSNGLEFDGQPGSSYAESLALFGLPISERMEMLVGGRTLFVQWFERARFEWHPDNPEPYRVLLGRLGADLLVAPVTPAVLVVGTWRLESFGPTNAQTSAAASAPATMTFDADGRLSGSTGCNSFQGIYRLENTQLTFGQIASTLRACLGEEVSQQETALLNALQGTVVASVSAEQLRIFYNNDRAVLTLRKST